MTIQSYRMGPGTLTLDTSGSLDVSCQVLECTVEAAEKVDKTDDTTMLCGEVLAGDETITFDWTAKITFQQDLATAGVVTWSWTNAGQTKPFIFIPSTSAGRKVTGSVKVTPIGVGGKAKERPTSDVTWRLPTAPAIANTP